MRHSHRRWWLVFGMCAAGLFVLLGWMSGVLLELESREAGARAEMRQQTALRLALWRMDSWLTPHLAAEAARAPEEYEPIVSSAQQPTTFAIGYRPSSLLGFESEFIRLHFQLVQRGDALSNYNVDVQDSRVVACSPQVPSEIQLTLPELSKAPPTAETLLENQRRLSELARVRDIDRCFVAVAQAEERILAAWNRAPASVTDEYAQREMLAQGANWAANEQQNQQRAQRLSSAPRTGPFVPIWLEMNAAVGESDRELCYMRRLRKPEGDALQGFLVDWPRLEKLLLAEVADLCPEARMEPVLTPGGVLTEAADGSELASLPVRLVPASLCAPTLPRFTPARLALAVTWLAALVALAASAITLRASIAFGEKRSRFASAVTHELRTPLTTFRMYSEMLADGMVTEEARKQEYLATLKEESGRLAGLVENVLAYARLEEGRAPARRERLAATALIERHRPQWERRVREADMELRVEVGAAGARELFVDPDAVGQVLANLIDNACKYGRSAHEPGVEVTVEEDGDRVRVRVRDFGAGIEAHGAAGLFAPFDRCGKESSSIAGVGLGLALARGIAREMGGTLELDAGTAPGACFVLTLPARG